MVAHYLLNALSIAALVFGFGFVVFFHELGHFLAAKWVGIKVEQFAVGFGQAICAWRKGIGFRWGSTRKDYESRIKDYLEAQHKNADPTSDEMSRAGDELHLGETEYRLNWLPLGGYVKMLGQDDLNPNAQSEDPRSYNRKSVRARMLVVSAGVVMNVILAAALFMALFLYGYRVPPPVVGTMLTNSPAQQAHLQVGDKIIYFDEHYQHDYTSLRLATALVHEGFDIPIYVEHPDGTTEHLTIRPRRTIDDPKAFLDIGVGQFPLSLQGPDNVEPKDLKAWQDAAHPDPAKDIYPGDLVTAVGDTPVTPDQYYVLDRALQQSNGVPVKLTVTGADGKPRIVEVQPRFQPFFANTPVNIAGLQPRPVIDTITEGSPVQKGDKQLLPHDIITSLSVNGELINNPTVDQFIDHIGKAGELKQKVDIGFLRDGKPGLVTGVSPDMRIGQGKHGLGVHIDLDESHPVVSGTLANSPASKALTASATTNPSTQPAQAPGIDKGAAVKSIAGQPVSNWYDILTLLKHQPANTPISILYTVGQGPEAETVERKLTLTDADLQGLQNVRYTHEENFKELIKPRKTSSPVEAFRWGVTETRDLLLQFYVTLHRLTQGSVSASNFMGPVGIVSAGSQFALKGVDWLIWFLAMISANLAVVNFLPIPIVDGGLFTFLILEKVQGRPLSARAQTVAQLVGLGIILSVFVFVTFQDISRLFL